MIIINLHIPCFYYIISLVKDKEIILLKLNTILPLTYLSNIFSLGEKCLGWPAFLPFKIGNAYLAGL